MKLNLLSFILPTKKRARGVFLGVSQADEPRGSAAPAGADSDPRNTCARYKISKNKRPPPRIGTDSGKSVPIRRNGLNGSTSNLGSNEGTIPNNFGDALRRLLGVVCLFLVPGIKPFLPFCLVSKNEIPAF